MRTKEPMIKATIYWLNSPPPRLTDELEVFITKPDFVIYRSGEAPLMFFHKGDAFCINPELIGMIKMSKDDEIVNQ